MSAGAPDSVALQVRQQRLRLGWRQADVASRAGVSNSAYARFEARGQITLGRLLSVAAALGLSLDLRAADGATIAPNPALLRQRGVRQPPTTPRPEKPKSDPSGEPAPTIPTPRSPPVPAKPPAAPPRAAVDGAEVAEAAKQYEIPIRMLVGVIVMNRLNNYTAKTSVQNVMRAQHVESKGAFVAAVEAKLGELTGENCSMCGIDPPHLKLWSDGWRPELGIVGAAE